MNTNEQKILRSLGLEEVACEYMWFLRELAAATDMEGEKNDISLKIFPLGTSSYCIDIK